MNTAQTTLQKLSALEPVKTWSLIVTLLGDMQDPQLSGKQMGRLLGHVGLKPEAIRVAIHRLKKDGWINTSKNGREVIYRLSALGKSATKAAYDDVYRTDLKYRTGWKLLIVESDEAFKDQSQLAIRLLKRVYLLPSDRISTSKSALDFDIQDRKIPEWMIERLVPVDVIDIARKLNAIATTLIEKQLFNNKQHSENPFDNAALRLLILHRWRKMALRDSTWAHISLFPDGAMAQCHHQVTQLLAELPRLDAGELLVNE